MDDAGRELEVSESSAPWALGWIGIWRDIVAEHTELEHASFGNMKM